MKAGGIRPARAREHDAIRACVDAAYSKYVGRVGKEPAPMLADYPSLISEGVVYVISDGPSTVGVLTMMPMNEAVFVENIAVRPSHQGLGLGRGLMRFVEEFAERNGLREIRLYTNELMEENIAFYLRLGFEEVDRRLEDGYRRVFMRKPLVHP